MRLRRLDLTRYGRFTDYAIDFGPRLEGKPDLHLVYGLNEAGKSTALSGYLDLLFGIEERSRYNFLHPYDTMEVGAALEVGDTVHELRRVKQRSASLRDGAGQPVNEALLGAALAGLTRETYRTMFSLDDETLEAGGNAILDSKGDLGELLFSASAGLADLSGTLDAVGKEADEIFRKRASSTEIAKLKRELAELKARREEIDVQASAHAGLIAALKEATQAYDETAQALAAARIRHERLERLLRAAPWAQELHGVTSELDALSGLPQPPAHWAADLQPIMSDDTRLETRRVDLDARLERLAAEMAGIVVDEGVLALSARIGQLERDSSRYVGAQDDLPRRRETLVAHDARIGALVRALGRTGEVEAERLLVAAPLAATLRGLIAQKSGVATAAETAAAELEEASAALERAKEDLARLDATGATDNDGPIAVLHQAMDRLRKSDLAARLSVAAKAYRQRRQEFEQALACLRPWSGDGAALRALAVPETLQMERWRGALSHAEAERSTVSKRLSELIAQDREQEARGAALATGGDTLDDAGATALRAARDAAWEAHLARLDRPSAEAFEQKMRATDAVADLRLARAHDVAQLRELSIARATTRAQIAHQQGRLGEIDADLSGLAAALSGAIPLDLGVGQDLEARLARVERWLREREGALAALTELEAVEADSEALRGEAARERDHLAMLLAGLGVAAEGVALADLQEVAAATLAGADERRKAREAARQALDAHADAVARRRRAADAATAKLDAWRDKWEAALAATWFADRGDDVGAVGAILDTLGDLASELGQRTEMEHRVTAMARDQAKFADDLATLLAELGEDLDRGRVMPAAEALFQRLATAKQSRTRRLDKEKERGERLDERRALDTEMALHDARKRELLDFFGATQLLEVDAALKQCAERDSLDGRRRSLAANIVSELRAASLEEALAALEGLDQAALSQERAELSRRIEDLDRQATERLTERARAEERVNRIGGDDAVARIEAERRTVLLEIEDQALRFLRLKAGALMAAHALRAYREKHRSSMMQRASEAFRLMTREGYSGLATRPDKDRETLIGVARGGGSKLASDMSKGTRFQLYLALRLAGYEEFAAVRPSVPFIADDIMETFDEPRSEEVFRLFSRMARVGQVIYLTHHRHLCDLARQVAPEVQVHEIAA